MPVPGFPDPRPSFTHRAFDNVVVRQILDTVTHSRLRTQAVFGNCQERKEEEMQATEGDCGVNTLNPSGPIASEQIG
jgi:hypothetical protein